MSSSKDINNEDLKKLEDQAYFELCQIIAEALEYQDVELLDARIATWKTKYKKLLDRPSTSSKSDFKKRIEFLLNQYYSSVTQYILSQLKLNEEKKIEKQAKAMKELYRMIKETNDLDLLKKKVEKWKEKYPVSGFLRMYQRRIESYTREKNLEQNAFKQEEAFSDLVDITKKLRTFDELKEEIALWENKYSINNVFTIDDFIKHQSEVKRFTSDEFLQSIARDDEVEAVNADKLIENNTNDFSSLSVQSHAYAALVAISTSPDSVNEMFKWVYKNCHIKFNDKYKELILRSTYLNYRPAFLHQLSKPKIDMSKDSLSYDEYKNMDDIKRYAIISYFNLLLPKNQSISNDYFNKNIQIIYSKSEKAKTRSNIKKDNSSSIENVIDLGGIEIPLTVPNKNTDVIDETTEVKIEEKKPIKENNNPIVIPSIKEVLDKSNEIIDVSDNETEAKLDTNSERNESSNIYGESKPKSLHSENLDTPKESTYMDYKQDDSTLDLDTSKEIISDDISEKSKEDIIDEKPKPKSLHSENLDTPKEPTYMDYKQDDSTLDLDTSKEIISNDISEKSKEDIIDEKLKTKSLHSENLDTPKEPTYMDYKQDDSALDLNANHKTKSNDEIAHFTTDIDNSKSNFDYDTVVTLSPLFFSAINNYDRQAVLINSIDSTTTKYVKSEKSRSLEIDTIIKTKK